MTKEEKFKLMLADALYDKEFEKGRGDYWCKKWEESQKRIDELSDAFADAVKELTDLQILNETMKEELEEHEKTFDFIYGKKGQLEVAE